MSVEHFQQLLEEVQIDVSNAEREIADLQGILKYVERKQSDGGSDAYSAMQKEVQQDIESAEARIVEMRQVETYARTKLQAAGGSVPEFKVPDKEEPKKPEPKKAPPKKSAPKKAPEAAAGGVENMQTIEFGPDGFPLNSN